MENAAENAVEHAAYVPGLGERSQGYDIERARKETKEYVTVWLLPNKNCGTIKSANRYIFIGNVITDL